MFYKIIENGKVIDVLDHLTYLKYQPKNNIMLLCDINEAQAILSSDKNTIWHVEGLYDLPIDGYKNVKVVAIDEFEYKKLRVLNMKSPEEIVDEYTLLLIDSDMGQFVESLKRLYANKKVNEEKILNLCKNGKITEDEKKYILDK